MGGLLRMDYDAAAADRCGEISAVQGVELIVIDNGAVIGLVPNLDAELVRAAAPSNSTVDGGEDEAVAAGIVHGAGAFVLRARAGNHQPLVAGAVEVEVGDLELKLGFARGHGGPLLIAGDKTEAGFARERGLGSASPVG